MNIFIASDHAGFELKSILIQSLSEIGHTVIDSGAYAYHDGDDYPQFIAKAARAVSESEAVRKTEDESFLLTADQNRDLQETRGIVIGGSTSGGSSGGGGGYTAFVASSKIISNDANNSRVQTAYVYSRNLQQNMRGEDVRQLQIFLNTHGFQVSKVGVGSLGNETAYFGPATRLALIQFQKANKITPAVGFLGPITRALIHSL